MAHPPPRNAMVQLLSENEAEEPTAQYQRRLIELAEGMDVVHTFCKGQIVKWKAGLRNRPMPAYNEIAVVREVLTEPVFEMCDHSKCAGSPLFREPLTLVLAMIDSDGDFIEFHYDGRRFEPAADM